MIDLDIIEGKFTYRNKKTNEFWEKWKKWDELTEEEKLKINLITPAKHYVILDKDLNTDDEKTINEEYNKTKEKILSKGIKFFYADRSPKGFHIYIPFKNLEKEDDKTIKEIRKIYVEEFDCDEAKISLTGVISCPERPHFKNNITYPIFDEIPGKNELSKSIINIAKERTIKKEENIKNFVSKIDNDFKDFFETDPFFLYLKSNIIPDNTGRDIHIFPNLAIASIKTGKSLEEIENILKPIIQTNFPGKTWNEFNGWLRKAQNYSIEFNPIQINNWFKTFTNVKKDVYDLTPLPIELQILKESQLPHSKFLTDKELSEQPEEKMEWVIDKWIPKGDICFIAGKSGSFKTTISLHIIYAISQGKLVFNKYETKKSKVLYVNEENYKQLFKGFIKRVKAGLDINGNLDDVHFSIMENLRFENQENIKDIINYIKKNNIEVVVFDSFRRFFIGEENDAGVINDIFNKLKIIRKICGDITIIVIHHAKKDGINGGDIRDILRGSSDIVNSADSVIGIKRKTGQNTVLIEHIKNRAGEEMVGKLMRIDSVDNKFYIYETEVEVNKDKLLNEHEKCANKIVQFLEDNHLQIFERKDIKDLGDYDKITRALRYLIDEGTITSSGSTSNRKFIFNGFTGEVNSVLE